LSSPFFWGVPLAEQCCSAVRVKKPQDNTWVGETWHEQQTCVVFPNQPASYIAGQPSTSRISVSHPKPDAFADARTLTDACISGNACFALGAYAFGFCFCGFDSCCSFGYAEIASQRSQIASLSG